MTVITQQMMFMIFSILFSVLKLGSGNKVYVNAITGTDSITCGSLSSPCKSLRAGLARVLTHGTLIVAPGLYTGINNCNLCNSTKVLGCQPSISIVGQGSPSQVIVQSNIPNLRALLISDNTVTKISNITFQNFLYGHPSDLTISSLFSGLNFVGGAVSIVNSAVQMSNVIFAGNTASEGGALSLISSNASLVNVTFSNNIATYLGGAISINKGSINITNCEFNSNRVVGTAQTDGLGGAMFMTASSDETFNLAETTFFNNSAGHFLLLNVHLIFSFTASIRYFSPSVFFSFFLLLSFPYCTELVIPHSSLF